MFGRFRNPVLGLHRFAVGNLELDASLAAGQWRQLDAQEAWNTFENKKLLELGFDFN
jgi:16S rRNA pseudouridine516 synthase